MIDLHNNSLSKEIAQRIAEKIISGELKPGEKLIEQSYAEEYGTSRSPVREAIFLLTVEGLVERFPRKCAVVKAYSEAEIYDLLEMRIFLESLAMKRILSSGVNAELLAEMEKILKEMEKEKDIHHYTELNHTFHMFLIEMSQSDVIKNGYIRLKLPLLTVQGISFANEGNIQKSIQEHKQIIQLLKNDALSEASEMLNQHNRDVITSIQNRLKKSLSSR
jgi:DNA-binding GntR family transcriptional regulator